MMVVVVVVVEQCGCGCSPSKHRTVDMHDHTMHDALTCSLTATLLIEIMRSFTCTLGGWGRVVVVAGGGWRVAGGGWWVVAVVVVVVMGGVW